MFFVNAIAKDGSLFNVGRYIKEEDAIAALEEIIDDPWTEKAWYFYRYFEPYKSFEYSQGFER